MSPAGKPRTAEDVLWRYAFSRRRSIPLPVLGIYSTFADTSILGAILLALATVATFAAQVAMRASWRISRPRLSR